VRLAIFGTSAVKAPINCLFFALNSPFFRCKSTSAQVKWRPL